MTAIVTLDQQGRLELRQEMREDLHLSPGSTLQIEQLEGKLLITPSHESDYLKEVGGLLVFTGEIEPGQEGRDWVREMHEERIRELLK